MKIGSIDILKAYLGALELTNSNAFVGTIPVIENGAEPLDKDYFYLQPLVAGDYSISANDEVWKQNNTFEFRLNKTNWRKFSSLTHSTDYVGFDVYMTNNPDLVALALDINAYNTYVVDKNYIVGISQMGGDATETTFLGTDENFAYYVGTLEEPDMMHFQWGFIISGIPFLNIKSNYSTDRMFEWDGTKKSGTNTDISDYSSFNISSIIITETIPLSANDKLYLRNTSGSIHSGIISSIQSVNHNIGGILNTLTDYTDDTYTITSNYADGLFREDSKLISAGDLKLPATTLEDYCYVYMFQGCSNLTTAPALPATTLSPNCYKNMFSGCRSLTTAPALPATTLTVYCYISMFADCTSLTTAPALPATTLAYKCYEGMFKGCTSLTSAPELPATTLANYCYYSMFNGCTSLTTAPELPATTLAEYCYGSMFQGCSSLTTAPELPATTLAEYCYGSMFSVCTSLTTAPELPVTTLAIGCYIAMFNGCRSLTTAPELPATTLAGYCYGSMFSGCSSLTTAPELPATTLAEYCYQNMFINCNKLNYIKCLATNISAKYCTSNWVNKVASTGTFVKDASMTDWTEGSEGIPSGWTVQDAA